MTQYTLVHVADIHFRPGWDEEIGVVVKAFFADVEKQLAGSPNTFLVLSGDVVQGGDEVLHYEEFATTFGTQFDALGLTRDRRICVPGNHDVSRAALKDSILLHQGAISAIRDEESFNSNISTLSSQYFSQAFKNYRAFETAFARYGSCAGGLGGGGHNLGADLSVYCLNSTLTSAAGLTDARNSPIKDQTRLMVDTRSLYRWVNGDPSGLKILVAHHPSDWLCPWAETEIERSKSEYFTITLHGHTHDADAMHCSRGNKGPITCSAPPLFTQKAGRIGYTIIHIDTESGSVSIRYRQLGSSRVFVPGTTMSNTEDGTIHFGNKSTPLAAVAIPQASAAQVPTRSILETDFSDALMCYSMKRQLWIDRDLSRVPENVKGGGKVPTHSSRDVLTSLRSLVVRAPAQYGLSCLSRYWALEYHKLSTDGKVLIVANAADMPADSKGIRKEVDAECRRLGVSASAVAGFVFDPWDNEKHSTRVLREISTQFKGLPIIIMYGVDDCSQLGSALRVEDRGDFETLYLWALSRSQVREMTRRYVDDLDHLDENAVAQRVIADLDSLNVHRTPMNCLLLLKYAEDAFDDSPVNRMEVIGRVLYLLFYQFNKIPRYATRPDLKDCEYTLGYLCEWLVREHKVSFSREEFQRKCREYCDSQLLDIDLDILLSFLMSENILVARGSLLSFKFMYWLDYFAAHRMHHDPAFAEFILGGRRYSAYPEIVEFYAGIDRRRSDAVIRLTSDLASMNEEFVARTGIPAEFNPYQHARWEPTPEDVQKLLDEVDEGVAESSLPMAVKDAIADRNYDRSQPYNQELANFIERSSLRQLIQAMRGAARTLRNSDHVPPEVKLKLIEEVMKCWVHVCQVLVILSPMLAAQRRATFEDASFVLAEDFPGSNEQDMWNAIMSAVTDNVVRWYEDDISSRKMGALMSRYAQGQRGKLEELLTVMVMAKHKIPGWDVEVKRLIVECSPNAFYLGKLFTTLLIEYKEGFCTERSRQALRRLAATALAKHRIKARDPNQKMIEKGMQALDQDEKSQVPGATANPQGGS